jgi:hypothetical protein
MLALAQQPGRHAQGQQVEHQLGDLVAPRQALRPAAQREIAQGHVGDDDHHHREQDGAAQQRQAGQQPSVLPGKPGYHLENRGLKRAAISGLCFIALAQATS